jgi:hypothetical protein
MLSAKDAFSNLKYAPGVGIEIAIAYWLSSQGGPAFGAPALVAYALIATSALVLLVGFFWYWAWFAERGFAGRYLLGVSFLVGVALWSAGQFLRPDDPQYICGLAQYPPCPNTSSLVWFFLWAGACLVAVPLLFEAWCLVKFIIVRVFGVLLVAISQIGAAWRGETRL